MARTSRPSEETEGPDRYSRTRRAIYVFGCTIAFIGIAAALTFLGYTGPLAEHMVDGLIGLVELIIIFYLSTTTIDRSEILTNIGRGMRRGFRSTVPDGQEMEVVRPEDLENKDDDRRPVG